MTDDDIRLIAAVGRQGQIGLDGGLPWDDARDLQHFRLSTTFHSVVMGSTTFDAMVERRALVYPGAFQPLPDRHTYRFSHRPGEDAAAILERWRSQRHHDGILWIAGGAQTYRAWIAFCRERGLRLTADISLMSYDGDADTYMPSLWQGGFSIPTTA